MTYNFDQIIDRSSSNSVKYDIRQAYFGNKNVIPLWVADMDFATPECIRKAILKRANHEIYGYSIKPDSYFTSIQNWLKTQHNWSIPKTSIDFSPGVVPGLVFSILALTNPGDKIIVQTPVYFPFFISIEGNNREMLVNPLKEKNGYYEMDFEDLKSKIDSRTKMILLSSPHNPVGRVWKKEELEELIEICVKNDIIIASDEIHADLVFKPHKHIPLASLSEKAKQQTITFMAPSKTFNMAGLSSSFVIIENEEYHKKYRALVESYHLTNGNLFGTVGTEAAYSHGAKWLSQMLSYTEKNIDFVSDYFAKHIPQIFFYKPEGTYLLWINFKALKMTDAQLKEFLVHRAEIGLNQGIVFGENGTGYMRMNVACPRSLLEKALNQLKAAIDRLDLQLS
ncbi:MAG: PatB family C-S lyase [Bacteroidales bacterium]|nr:PatB family C-S lyase [Bacteroidales bacterium]